MPKPIHHFKMNAPLPYPTREQATSNLKGLDTQKILILLNTRGDSGKYSLSNRV